MSDKPSELKQQIKTLKGEFRYAEARQLLQQALSNHPGDNWCSQQLALCTYKDEELLPATRFDEALTILKNIGLRDAATDDPETLALGGAIYKRRWEYGGQLEHLFNALHFYRAAFERNPEQDAGYGGINAAYILDVLAARAMRTDAKSAEAQT